MSRAARVRTWAASRPALCAALLYGALALAFVSPALVPGRTLASTDYLYTQAPWSGYAPPGFTTPENTELYDPALQFVPWFRHTRAELPGGGLLWNPHLAAGRPFLANMQSALFSPFSLVAFVLPFWSSLALIAALKLFVASFGTFLFARRLGQSFGAALLAGATFGFSLYVVVHLASPIGSVYVLIPWLLVAAHDLVRRPGARVALWLGVACALGVVGGHPESTLHAFGLAALYGAFLVLADPDARRRGRAVAAWALAALTLAALLSAVVLVPFTELLWHSSDFGNRTGNASRLPSSWIGAIALPEYFGTPTDATGGTVRLGAVGLFIARAVYAGALPLMLAALALWPAIVRRRGAAFAGDIAVRRFFGLFAVGCLLVVFGAPGVFDLVRVVPVLGQTNNTRLIILYLLALAVLAGFGLDDLRRRGGVGDRRAAVALGAAVFVLPLVTVLASPPAPGRVLEGVKLALGFASDPGNIDVVHARSWFWWVLFATLALAVLVTAARGRLRGPALVAAAVALACADLFRAGQGFNPDLPQATAKLPTTPAIRYLQDQRPARFVGLERALQPDQAMSYGLYDARNYDFPIVKRYDVLWRRHVFPLPYQPGAPQWVLTLTPASLRVLGLLGVRDVLVPRDEQAYARQLGIGVAELGLGLPGLRQVYSGRDGRVYRNARALPRAWVVHTQRVVGGEEASLRAVGDPRGPDLRRVAVTERPLAGLARESAGASSAPAGSRAGIVSYGPQRVVLESRAARAGLLVLSDVHYPGWKATVGGHPVDIERVDYLLRGVRVPAGRSRVVMSYAPASFRAGAVGSVAGLLAVLAALFALARARTRPRRVDSPTGARRAESWRRRRSSP